MLLQTAFEVLQGQERSETVGWSLHKDHFPHSRDEITAKHLRPRTNVAAAAKDGDSSNDFITQPIISIGKM